MGCSAWERNGLGIGHLSPLLIGATVLHVADEGGLARIFPIAAGDPFVVGHAVAISVVRR